MKRRYARGWDFRLAKDVFELRTFAKRRVPAFVMEYLEGGAEDELTLERNRSAFSDYWFVHRSLVDMTECSTQTTVFGRQQQLPVAIGPTGFNGLLWKNGDIAAAKVARDAGVPFVNSMVSSDSLQAICEQAGGEVWFQMVVLQDAEVMEGLIRNAEDAGCPVLVVTVDANVMGNRSWDARHFVRPGVLSFRSKIDVLMHLRWLFSVFLPRGLPSFGNLTEFLPPTQRGAMDGARYLASGCKHALSWDDIARLRDRWNRQLVVKGLLSPQDVDKAIGLGVDGVVLSNHGGRQLDGDVSALDVLPTVRAQVGDRTTLFVDGGIRRGSDIVKALALGADAVLLGRSVVYGLAAGGGEGARHAVELLKNEVGRVIQLLGCKALRDIDSDYLLRTRQPACRDAMLSTL